MRRDALIRMEEASDCQMSEKTEILWNATFVILFCFYIFCKINLYIGGNH